MRKTLVAITLAMMSIFLVGCYKEMEPNPNLVSKLMGRWVVSYTDDEPVLTNAKMVYNYVSTTEAYLSASFNAHPEKGSVWVDLLEANVVIQGSKITLTYHPGQNSTAIHEFTVRSINDSELSAYAVITVTTNGAVVLSEQGPVRFKKAPTDYSAAILGLWEGQMVSQESEYDDGQEHRWLFNDDGSFTFYLKNEKGVWVEKNDEFAEYFVAGDLLCTRWENAGVGAQECREWWDITAVSEDRMVWTALREKKDGTKYTAAFSMHKVNVPTQAEIEKAIVGKWITALTDGEDIPTNEKIVFDIVSPTEAYVSLSIQDRLNEDTPWTDREAVSILIYGNNVVLSHGAKPGMVITVDLKVEAITDETLTAKRTVTLRQDGGLVKSDENMVLYEKMDVDYRKAICGLWEGHLISDQSEYDDGKEHRWEYKEDGTFVYYNKNSAGAWVPGDDSMNEYFVAGNLLCTRWMENGVENREWWEITAMSSTGMVWTSLREKEDGTRYTAAFSMSRVANLGE